MRRIFSGSGVACALFGAFAPGVVHAQEINTTTGGTDAWGGWNVVQFSSGNDEGAGQIFTVPAAKTFLGTFSFWLVQNFGASEFTAHVAAWNGSSYSDIWTSDPDTVISPVLTTSPASLAHYRERVFSPAVTLVPAQTYLAYVRVSRAISYSGAWSGGWLAARSSSFDPEAGLVVLGNGNVVNVLRNYQAAFTADLTTPVPEPATVVLLATGVVGILGVGVIRRRRS